MESCRWHAVAIFCHTGSVMCHSSCMLHTTDTLYAPVHRMCSRFKCASPFKWALLAYSICIILRPDLIHQRTFEKYTPFSLLWAVTLMQIEHDPTYSDDISFFTSKLLKCAIQTHSVYFAVITWINVKFIRIWWYVFPQTKGVMSKI